MMTRVDSSTTRNSISSSSEQSLLNPTTSVVDSSSNCSPPPSSGDHHLPYDEDPYTSKTGMITSPSSENHAKDMLESRNAIVERFVDSDLARCVSNEEETEIEENRNDIDMGNEDTMAHNHTTSSKNESKTIHQQAQRMSLKMLSLTNPGKEDLDAFYYSDIVSLSGTPAKPQAVLPTPANFVARLDSSMDKNVLNMDIPFASPKVNDFHAKSLVFSPLEKLSSKSNSQPRNHFFPPATPNHTTSNRNKRLLDESSTCTSQLSKKPKVESPFQLHTRRKIQIPEHAKKYGTQLSIEIFQHFTITEFEETDRGCKRVKLALGTYGFACAYCNGRHGKKRGGRCGRYFPSSLKTLADPNKILFSMYRHLQRCEDCPPKSKERLDSAYEKYETERLGQGRGFQKKFYKEVWRDLHRGRLGVDDEFVVA